MRLRASFSKLPARGSPYGKLAPAPTMIERLVRTLTAIADFLVTTIAVVLNPRALQMPASRWRNFLGAAPHRPTLFQQGERPHGHVQASTVRSCSLFRRS